jgi:hypothetical protein
MSLFLTLALIASPLAIWGLWRVAAVDYLLSLVAGLITLGWIAVVARVVMG